MKHLTTAEALLIREGLQLKQQQVQREHDNAAADQDGEWQEYFADRLTLINDLIKGIDKDISP